MVSQPVALPLEVTEAQPLRARLAMLADYWALTKPEVNLLILITTFAGFCLALPAPIEQFPVLLLINTLLGTLLVASGTGSLNQFLERNFDAQMRRTSRRPVASGRIAASSALWFGIALSSFGCLYLRVAVNTLSSLLALITLLSYLFLYTPLKRKTPLCTFVGALPGAMPPLIGWAGIAGRLNLEAWSIYAILFLWQFPHFMAIAWMYREDYLRAGYMVLPCGETRGNVMALQSVLPSLFLVPLGIVPLFLAHSHLSYWVANILFSSGFLVCTMRLAFQRSNWTARRLLFASIIYLPMVLFVILLSKV
jgi:protoheme IX farnesyltransferase